MCFHDQGCTSSSYAATQALMKDSAHHLQVVIWKTYIHGDLSLHGCAPRSAQDSSSQLALQTPSAGVTMSVCRVDTDLQASHAATAGQGVQACAPCQYQPSHGCQYKRSVDMKEASKGCCVAITSFLNAIEMQECKPTAGSLRKAVWAEMTQVLPDLTRMYCCPS